MNAITGSQAHADYVIGRVFCHPLKQAFYVVLESEAFL